MVPQEPAPLPVRPRRDFEAGPVTGASLATGQIPVIGVGGPATVQGQPVDQAEDDADSAAPAPVDDAAWTASLRLDDAPAWSGPPSAGTADWSYPQIFSPADPPSPISGVGPFIAPVATGPAEPVAAGPCDVTAMPTGSTGSTVSRVHPSDRSDSTQPGGLVLPAAIETPDPSARAQQPARNARTADQVQGPPTAATTQLPLRRQLRELHPEPAPGRSRLRTALGVMAGALRRQKHRPHRGSADPNTLGTRFSPRNNHLGLMRLVLALTVGVTHATEIGFGWQPVFAQTQLGAVCVDAFFVLSGFLLVGSYLRLDSIRRYTWHRFLRIMPGFWVCLVVTATLIAPLIAWLQGVPMRTLVTGEDSAVDYVIRNAALMMRQWGIGGLPSDVELTGVLNGSLWTLFYEASCYASIIALGLLGGLRRRPVMTLGAVGALWVVTVLNDYQIIYIGQERILRLSFMFLIGSVLYLYAHHVPVNRLLTLASAATVVAGIAFFDDYRVLAGPAFGYLCLAVAVSRVRLPEPRTDISYGLYVYHWPLFQVLNLLGLAAVSIWVFVPAGLALASVVALLSWKLVEKPALGFKDAGWVTWKLPAVRAATSEVRA